MADTAQASRARRAASQSFKSVTCPFCSLLCDDLEIRNHNGELQVTANGCPRAVAGFQRPLVNAAPRAEGKPVALDKAIAAAAALFKRAQHPLIGGLATDVAGMRALLDVADLTGSIVDHMHGDALSRNMLALQNRGWMTTTLTEIRNRADLIVFAGTDVIADHPRFFERYVWNRESMFGMSTSAREIVYLGEGLDPDAGVSPDGRKPWHLKNEPKRLGELIAAARALLAGRCLQAHTVAGIKIRDVAKLVDKLISAKYGVIVWAPNRFNFAGADLTVEMICELVKELNAGTRCSGLSLGGNDGAVTAGAVCTWQSGYPLRTDFARGYPAYDPTANAATALLAAGEVDLLLWVTSFSAHALPTTTVPTILLAPPIARPPAWCSVYIPVGTPGVDHRGQMCRVDNVVSLPLHKLRDSALPTVESIAQRLLQLI